jgi:hypothetical protein
MWWHGLGKMLYQSAAPTFQLALCVKAATVPTWCVLGVWPSSLLSAVAASGINCVACPCICSQPASPVVDARHIAQRRSAATHMSLVCLLSLHPAVLEVTLP